MSKINWLKYHDAMTAILEDKIASYSECNGPRVERELSSLKAGLEIWRRGRPYAYLASQRVGQPRVTTSAGRPDARKSAADSGI